MAAPWIARGLRRGIVTTRWPRHDDPYFDQFQGGIDPITDGPALAGDEAEQLAARCPTGAITTRDGDVELDRGRCILCGRCVAARPDLFRWHSGAATATLTRSALVMPNRPETDEQIAAVRRALALRVRRLGRSVHIRHVDAGSDGSDEWEVQALVNPVYDVHRLGIFFTASPRHADLLLVTGIGTAGMVAPLRRTREAMPDPVIVIAAGTDAISGGLIGGGYTAGHGIGGQLPVDVWIPGSPASPFSLLHGILLAIGRLPRRGAA